MYISGYSRTHYVVDNVTYTQRYLPVSASQELRLQACAIHYVQQELTFYRQVEGGETGLAWPMGIWNLKVHP